MITLIKLHASFWHGLIFIFDIIFVTLFLKMLKRLRKTFLKPLLTGDL